MSTILELKNVTKLYPGVTALDGVSVSFEAGEIHAIMGENGAGKSTLIKIIAGAIPPNEGSIIIGGCEFNQMRPALSKEHGIGVIYQEFNLIASMTVAENIFMGDKIGGVFVADFKEMHQRSRKIFSNFNLEIDTEKQIEDLSIAQQQIVEIAKAISKDAKVLIMDEPSAALSIAEVAHMLEIIKKLKASGVTIIYISHRMDEVFEIADRVTVLRDGKYIATHRVCDVARKDLIELMVGREFSETFPSRSTRLGEVVLEAKNLIGNGNYNINFTLKKGEILGIAGLIGAGRTELAKVLYGAAKLESGEIWIKGKKVNIKSPRQAIACGIGLIPEDRKNEGVFLDFSIRWNIPIMSLRSISKCFMVSQKKADNLVQHYSEKLAIKAPDADSVVRNLSGGNQQKVALVKTLCAKTDILIFDEPTRGIDVGAKQEIYKLMNSIIEQGNTIIMISSEMEELVGMSDRIIVMHEGYISGELKKEEFKQSRILELASGL